MTIYKDLDKVHDRLTALNILVNEPLVNQVLADCAGTINECKGYLMQKNFERKAEAPKEPEGTNLEVVEVPEAEPVEETPSEAET